MEPKIIYKIVYFDSPLEINGKKIFITGRTGNQILGKHSYQLSLDYEKEKYIRDVTKYIDRCKAAKQELPLFASDHVSAEKNTELYKLFLDKLQAPVYYRLFSLVYERCEKGFHDFVRMSVYNQCLLLLEMLKTFKCDRQTSNLTAIGGAASSGIVIISKKISGAQSACLFHQSVTGLYEYKVDLLK